MKVVEQVLLQIEDIGGNLHWLYFRTCTGLVVLSYLQFFGHWFAAPRAAASLLHHTYAYHYWFQFELY